MKNLSVMLLIMMTSAIITVPAEARTLALKKEAVGVVFMAKETRNCYKLKLVFPEAFISGYPESFLVEKGDRITIPKRLIIFDDKGLLGEIAVPASLGVEFYCENDGGEHYRPTAVVTVAKSAFRRPLVRNKTADGAVAFVTGRGENLKPVEYDDATEARRGTAEYGGNFKYQFRTLMRGRLNQGGPGVAAIVLRSADAGCGDKLEEDSVNLKTPGNEEDLRCCGP